MKFLSWVALIIGAVVAIKELFYSSLDWTLLGLAVSVILLAVAQIVCHCCKCKSE
jgi:hypothetical protein